MKRRIICNEDFCIGCRLCEVYCNVKHSKSGDILLAYKYEKEKEPSRMAFEQKEHVCGSIVCMNCKDPLCIKACSMGAIKIEDGTVIIDNERCVGCWMCVMVCPFGAIKRGDKKAFKCDHCHGEEVPICVLNCPNKALIYEAD
jgi:carbon-monoxide dehydrogenase iron sulfur subunit